MIVLQNFRVQGLRTINIILLFNVKLGKQRVILLNFGIMFYSRNRKFLSRNKCFPYLFMLEKCD